jgi:hypothetical protein
MSKEHLNIEYSVTKAKDNVGYYCFNMNLRKAFLDKHTNTVSPQFHFTVQNNEDACIKAKTLLFQRYTEVHDFNYIESY